MYDVLNPELASRVRLIRVPKPPGPYVGLTIGRYVLLAGDLRPGDPSRLLAHELVHVRQWHELGVIGFLYRYLSDFAGGVVAHRSWRPAYHGIGAEEEARSEARGWAGRCGLSDDGTGRGNGDGRATGDGRDQGRSGHGH